MATASTRSPCATAGRMRRRWASVADSITVSAPSTPELKNGPGRGPRPISSYSTAASVRLCPLPPCSAGTTMPSHPSADAFRQRSAPTLAPARWSATIVSREASRSMKARAAPLSISWLSVRERSTGGRIRSVDGSGGFARGPADADPAGHADALDVGGAARVHGDDAVALLQLEERLGRAPRGIAREGGRADGFENRARHPESGGFAIVGQLRPLVRARSPRVGEPEVAHAEEPGDLPLDVDVGEEIAHVGVLAERHAV